MVWDKGASNASTLNVSIRRRPLKWERSLEFECPTAVFKVHKHELKKNIVWVNKCYFKPCCLLQIVHGKCEYLADVNPGIKQIIC